MFVRLLVRTYHVVISHKHSVYSLLNLNRIKVQVTVGFIIIYLVFLLLLPFLKLPLTSADGFAYPFSFHSGYRLKINRRWQIFSSIAFHFGNRTVIGIDMDISLIIDSPSVIDSPRNCLCTIFSILDYFVKMFMLFSLFNMSNPCSRVGF
jgi:hypothetical protein